MKSCCWAFSTTSGLRPQKKTRKPRSSNASTVARPMPRPPPVTRATRGLVGGGFMPVRVANGGRCTIPAMAGLRQTLSLALLALLLVLVAGPVAAAQCRMRGSCPMMKSGGAHRAVSTAPRTPAAWRRRWTAASRSRLPRPRPPCRASKRPPLPSLRRCPAARSPQRTPLPVAFSRAGQFHPLGLFTLHSVWRI